MKKNKIILLFCVLGFTFFGFSATKEVYKPSLETQLIEAINYQVANLNFINENLDLFKSNPTYTGTPLYCYVRKSLKAVIMGGQSNMEGGSNLAAPSATYQGYQRAWIYFKTDSSRTDNGIITQYNQAVNSSYRGQNAYVGPDVSVGYAYEVATGERILMIKYALGGSNLVDDGTTIQANGIWQIDADPTRASGLLHYRILINNFVIPCIKRCKAAGIDIEIVSFFWCQGESDSNSSYRSSHYQTELIRLIDGLTDTLETYNAKSQYFKPIITRIHNRFDPVRPYANDVRTAQVNVANYYNSYWINSDAYPLIADSTHWSNIGQQMHGNDFITILTNSVLP